MGKLQGKLRCQASRGRRGHPPSVPVPEAATTALAALHQTGLFLELATRQYPWPDLRPHCSQNNYILEKHPSLKFQPSQHSSLPLRVHVQLHNIITGICARRRCVFRVNACHRTNRCTGTICIARRECVHAIGLQMCTCHQPAKWPMCCSVGQCNLKQQDGTYMLLRKRIRSRLMAQKLCYSKAEHLY